MKNCAHPKEQKSKQTFFLFSTRIDGMRGGGKRMKSIHFDVYHQHQHHQHHPKTLCHRLSYKINWHTDLIHDFSIRRHFGHHSVGVQLRFHRNWVIFLIKNDSEWKRADFVRDSRTEPANKEKKRKKNIMET